MESGSTLIKSLNFPLANCSAPFSIRYPAVNARQSLYQQRRKNIYSPAASKHIELGLPYERHKVADTRSDG